MSEFLLFLATHITSINSSSCSFLFLPHPGADSITVCIVVVTVMVSFYNANRRIKVRGATIIYFRYPFKFKFDLTTYPNYTLSSCHRPEQPLLLQPQRLALTDDTLSPVVSVPREPTRSANLLPPPETDGTIRFGVCSDVIYCPHTVHLKLHHPF